MFATSHTNKLIIQSLRIVRRLSVGSRLSLTQKTSNNGQDKHLVIAPMKPAFLPDRAMHLPLNMIPELTELASFHLNNQPVGKMFSNIKNYGLMAVAKTQEIKLFPEFYHLWKPNDKLYIYCLLRDVGTKSFNVQFDIYDDQNTTMLCRNIRSIVVCDVKLKPSPIPEEILNYMQSMAFHDERYFIPQPYETKSSNIYKTGAIVKPSDLDILYHLNQANYFKFMLDAAVAAAKSGTYKSLKQDIAFASVDQIILNYARELRLDDKVSIETWEDAHHPQRLCFEMSSSSKMAFQGNILLREPLINLGEEIKRKFPRALEF